ncbi:hypothetical protein SAY86_022413 [Trapa natans]|uniref:Uncharacterized protein n=1 Tax=Trapa natans TaxID=22666 RepID=A0AAN7M5I3_TRANT|nr:hypothetical protein SAY86_022413 [Trapa natans]
MELVCKFVNRRPDIGTNEFDFNKVCSSKVVHLLDCLWRCHLSPRELMYPLESKSNCSTFMPCSPTCPGGELDFLASVPETRNFFLRLPKKVVGYLILGCLWRSWRRPCFLLVPSREANEVFHLGVSVPTATELHQSGVRFTQNIESTHLLDIKFDRQLGILKIPHFFMGDATEAIFRNLLAFEQCHYDEGPKFTDYFLFLGQLINEPRDVELLVKSGVIENTLGDSMRAASIINNITQGLSLTHFSYFDSLCKELTKYYKVPWHKWKAMLRQVYFDNPWAGISVIAAIILLLLTVVQAVFAVISK